VLLRELRRQSPTLERRAGRDRFQRRPLDRRRRGSTSQCGQTNQYDHSNVVHANSNGDCLGFDPNPGAVRAHDLEANAGFSHALQGAPRHRSDAKLGGGWGGGGGGGGQGAGRFDGPGRFRVLRLASNSVATRLERNHMSTVFGDGRHLRGGAGAQGPTPRGTVPGCNEPHHVVKEALTMCDGSRWTDCQNRLAHSPIRRLRCVGRRHRVGRRLAGRRRRARSAGFLEPSPPTGGGWTCCMATPPCSAICTAIAILNAPIVGNRALPRLGRGLLGWPRATAGLCFTFRRRDRFAGIPPAPSTSNQPDRCASPQTRERTNGYSASSRATGGVVFTYGRQRTSTARAAAPPPALHLNQPIVGISPGPPPPPPPHHADRPGAYRLAASGRRPVLSHYGRRDIVRRASRAALLLAHRARSAPRDSRASGRSRLTGSPPADSAWCLHSYARRHLLRLALNRIRAGHGARIRDRPRSAATSLRGLRITGPLGGPVGNAGSPCPPCARERAGPPACRSCGSRRSRSKTRPTSGWPRACSHRSPARVTTLLTPALSRAPPRLATS
jgi:hypothetical protein